MTSAQNDNEDRRTACIACLEPIRIGAAICPHCGTSQRPRRWRNFSQALKWIGGIVTTISLVVGIITLSRYYLDWKERHDAVSEIVEAAGWLIRSENYLQAWDMYTMAAELNPSSVEVRYGRFRLSLEWIRDFSIEKERLDSTLTSITEIMYRGLPGAGADPGAEILAHIGYIQVLRHINRLPVFTDVESLFEQALDSNPDNVYANAMYARWLMLEKPMTVERLDLAQRYYDRALASGRERAYVRSLQFVGITGYSYGHRDDIERNALTKLIGISIDMRENAEDYPNRDSLQKILDGYGPMGKAEHVEALVAALPAGPHLETYEWLLEADDESREIMQQQSRYVRARLNEELGDRDTALTLYRALLGTEAKDEIAGLVDRGIERLTGKLPARALARNYHDDVVDDSNRFQFHLDTLEHFDPTWRSPNYKQALAYFEIQIKQGPERLTALKPSLPTFIEHAREYVRRGDEVEKMNAYSTGFSMLDHDNARHSWIELVSLYARLLKTGGKYEQGLALLGDVWRSIEPLDQDWRPAQARLEYEMAALYALLAVGNNSAGDKEQSILLLLSAVGKGLTESGTVSWNDIKGKPFVMLADDTRYQNLIRGR